MEGGDNKAGGKSEIVDGMDGRDDAAETRRVVKTIEACMSEQDRQRRRREQRGGVGDSSGIRYTDRPN